jgi:hypothetical protein
MAFGFFQLFLLILIWLLYLQYPTMQLKMKLSPPTAKIREENIKLGKDASLLLSPDLLIAYAGLPVALSAGFASDYTVELQQVASKKEAHKRIKQLARQGIKAYFHAIQSEHGTVYKIRSGHYRGKALALLKGNMLRNKTNLTYAIVALP